MTSPSVVQSSNHAAHKHTGERVAFWWCWSCDSHIRIAQWLNSFFENIYFFRFCTPSGGKLALKLDQKRKLWVRPAVVKIKVFQNRYIAVRYLVELSLIQISAQSDFIYRSYCPKKTQLGPSWVIQPKKTLNGMDL